MRRGWIVLGLALLAVGIWWLAQRPSAGPAEELTADETDAPAKQPELRGGAALPVAEEPEIQTPQRGVIAGSVEDDGGRPLAGVPLVLERRVEPGFVDALPGRWLETEASGAPERYVEVATTHAADDGSFQFRDLPLNGRGYRVRTRADAPWTAAMRHVWQLSQGTFLRFVLARGTPLHVRVVDGHGAGLRAFLTCWREREGGHWFPAGFESLPTGADGRITAHLPDGAYQLSARVPGLGWRTGTLVEMPRAKEVLVPLAAAGGGSVTGRVTDKAGAPVGSARVLVISGDETRASLNRLATTTAEGAYRIDGLMAGAVKLLGVSAPGFVTVERRVFPAALEAQRVLTVDVTMVRGGILEGVVRGSDGRPLVGARVEANAEHSVQGLVGRDGALTDAGGRYRMTEVPPGAGKVRASAPGYYQPKSVRGFYVIEAESDRKVVDLALTRGTVVTGRVIDEAGEPVRGASVLASGLGAKGWWRGDTEDRTVLTDAAGRFAYPGLPHARSWKLVASTATGASEPLTVDTSGERVAADPVELTLRQGGMLQGFVLAAGEPVSDLVRVLAYQRTGGRYTIALRRDGSFAFAGLAPGDYEVHVVDWNLDAVSDKRHVSVTWGTVIDGLELAMERTSTIAGVLVDGEDEPVAGVSLQLDVSSPSHGRRLSTQTNIRGRFVFSNVPERDTAYPIMIRNVRQGGLVRPGQQDVRLILKRAEQRAFLGTVHLPDGTPAISGSVMLWELSPDNQRSGVGVSILDGAFATSIEVRSSDSTFEADVREVFDAQGRLVNIQPTKRVAVQPESSIAFHLEAGLELRGLVVDADGEPVADARVTILPQGAQLLHHNKTMKTREDGSFQFGGLPPGDVVVQVDRIPSPWIAPPPVTVQAGADALRLTLIRGSTIKGRVWAPDGKPLAGAVLQWSGKTGGQASRSVSGADGWFVLQRIPPGEAGMLSAWPTPAAGLPYLPASQSSVRAGAQGVELRLTAGVYIEGTIAGPAGEALASAQLMCRRTDAGQGPSTSASITGQTAFRLGPLAPGRYHITTIVVGDYVAPGALEVTAPAKGVSIVVPKGKKIYGTLTGADGLENFNIGYTRMTPDGPSTLGGNVTAGGAFVVLLRQDDLGTLYFNDRRGGDLYALVENARPSETPLLLRLQRGVSIAGRFEDYREGDDGYVYVQAPSGLNVNARVKADGTFLVRGLPPGTYDMHGFQRRLKAVSIEGVRAGTDGHVLRLP